MYRFVELPLHVLKPAHVAPRRGGRLDTRLAQRRGLAELEGVPEVRLARGERCESAWGHGIGVEVEPREALVNGTERGLRAQLRKVGADEP